MRSSMQICLPVPYFAFALLFMPLYNDCFGLFFLSLSLNSLPRGAINNIHDIAREMVVRKKGGGPRNFGCASTRKACKGGG